MNKNENEAARKASLAEVNRIIVEQAKPEALGVLLAALYDLEPDNEIIEIMVKNAQPSTLELLLQVGLEEKISKNTLR